MTDTADLVKELDGLNAELRLPVGNATDEELRDLGMKILARFNDGWPTIKAELSRLSARVAELENLCALRADNNRELVAMLDDANNRTESAESRAAAMREALEKLLPWLEDAETKCLVGDEGCIWAVEFVRQAIGERPCPRPIAGNKSGSARECIALGQCGCDEREIAARALQEG